MDHMASEHAVEESAVNWLEARSRLAADAEAELDDLIGPQFEE